MRRSNLWIIGVATAIVTVISLNAVFGPRHWGYYSGYRHHRGFYYGDCDGYDRRDSGDINRVPHQAADSTAHY